MATFYDQWLEYWDEGVAERADARKVIHHEELEWVETRQDARTALTIAPQTGFRTWGSVLQIAEIPTGSHTGRQARGEEVIHIVSGSGFSVIDNYRYDWSASSTIAIPFGVTRQHFNTGDETATYLTTVAVDLERFVGLHHLVQLEDWGPTIGEPDFVYSPNGDFDLQNRRRVMRIEDATDRTKMATVTDDDAPRPEIEEGKPLIFGTSAGMTADIQALHKSRVLEFMTAREPKNGFDLATIEISNILMDDPKTYGGTHAHMEAMLYILAGSGYSIIDGEKIPWKRGSSLHVQGPQTVHQHVNTSDEPSQMLRVGAGIRYLFENAAQEAIPYLYLGFKGEGEPEPAKG
jgi:quercetin dioxygenase-like cupin family protein